MKWLPVILFLFLLLPAELYAQDYRVVKRCMGAGRYAITVEYHNQFYVLETPKYFEKQWIIRNIPGIQHSGNQIMYYYDGVGAQNSMSVRILSRMRWKYAGEMSAKSICRQITRERF